VTLAATRALLRAATRAETARVLRAAINDLGGTLVPARLAGDDAIQVDVSLGEGEPQLVVADALSLSALRLAHQLPLLVQDAFLVANRCDYAERQARRVSVDALTGVGSRAEIGLRLGLTEPGDIVCLFDLDGLKQLNDTRGHTAGDQALRAFGALLLASVRAQDFCGRFGGDEFMVVIDAAPVESVTRRLVALVARWANQNGLGTTVSAGLAVVDERGAPTAYGAADRALYRAKRQGRSRLEVAGSADYEAQDGPG
jgi:diguanylate cyclase (GGDEF)-like protein